MDCDEGNGENRTANTTTFGFLGHYPKPKFNEESQGRSETKDKPVEGSGVKRNDENDHGDVRKKGRDGKKERVAQVSGNQLTAEIQKYFQLFN